MNDLVAGGAEAVYNAADLVALTRLPPWALALAALLLAVQLVLSFRATRGAPAQVRGGLFALRAALTLSIFALLLEPGWRLMATSKIKDRVVLAVDVSESMADHAEGQPSRAQTAARAALALHAELPTRDPAFIPELWVFDETARPATAAELEAIASGQTPPRGGQSLLGSVVQSVPPHDESAPLGGVVVFSDGGDTSGLTPALTSELREPLQKLGAPLHTVVTGDGAAFKDVFLERAIADEFAFVRNKVDVEVVIRFKGYDDLEVPLTLREDGRPVATTVVKLDADAEPLGVTGEARAKFTFEPQAAGRHIYSVTAPVQPDEAIADNNRVDFAMKLIRDRIRVLQVAGRPSWDQRFVRRLLKENPSVDLISFFILRSTTDVAGASNRELSLIPFPTRELFTDELGTFDVVIFQDFNYRPYQMGIYLENVRRFVLEQGGGFLMIGGELSFSEGDYDGTEIADILPVRLLPGRDHLSRDSFKPTVTEAGKNHPVTDLGDLVGPREGFEQLPELEGVNVVAGLAEGSEALLTHPFLNADDGPHPVVAVREAGKGRSMAVMTDSTWLWALPHVGAGGRGDAHRRFYANALRWLIKDPELSRVKVAVEQGEQGARGIEPGAEVPLEVRSFNARYQPEGGATLKLTLTPLDATDGTPPVTLEGETGADGAWRGRFTPDKPGAWRVQVEAQKDGRTLGVDEDAFVVRAQKAEKMFREPRKDVLRALAAAGAGQSVDPADATSLPFVAHGIERVHRQRTEPVWDHLWSLAVVVALAAAEWWWRRRRGFA